MASFGIRHSHVSATTARLINCCEARPRPIALTRMPQAIGSAFLQLRKIIGLRRPADEAIGAGFVDCRVHCVDYAQLNAFRMKDIRALADASFHLVPSDVDGHRRFLS
jgi:hypothetical protein